MERVGAIRNYFQKYDEKSSLKFVEKQVVQQNLRSIMVNLHNFLHELLHKLFRLSSLSQRPILPSPLVKKYIIKIKFLQTSDKFNTNFFQLSESTILITK